MPGPALRNPHRRPFRRTAVTVNTSTAVQLVDLQIRDAGTGISIDSSSRVSIRNCLISNMGFHAIDVINGSWAEIIGNTVTHALSKVKSLAVFADGKSRIVKLLKWAATFYLVLLGWVLFRSTGIGVAGDVLANMHGLGAVAEPAGNALTILIVVVACVLAIHLIDFFVIRKGEWLINKAWLLWLLLIIFQAFCLMAGEPSNEFIYFQF